MASIPTLRALLIDEIKDLFHAENQVAKLLTRLAKIAKNPALKTSFAQHLVQTRVHLTRLTESLKKLNVEPKGRTCEAMQGLVAEAVEYIDMKGPAAVRDAALIGIAQKIEHYEMAGYGTARAFAQVLDEKEVAAWLQETLDEEGSANRELMQIAAAVNAEAKSASADTPEGDEKSKTPKELMLA